MAEKLQIKNKIEPDKLIKVSPFRKEIRKTTPHTHHSYFEIIYLSEGSGIHHIDSRSYPVSPPLLYFVRREQVHFWELDTEPDGFVLILKKGFVDRSLDKEMKSLLIKVSKYSCVKVTEPDAVHSLFSLLCNESSYSHEYSFQITEGLLKSLLAKVLEMALPQKEQLQNKSLYDSFCELLENEDTVRNKVSHYAKILNTSPQNLNTACRKSASQSAAEVLSDHILAQAKRLLVYTNNSVTEIAANLDFSDTSHFVKYFKRLTGFTPLAYRKQQ